MKLVGHIFIFFVLTLFLAQDVCAQKWDVRVLSTASFPTFEYSNSTKPFGLDRVVNDVSLSLYYQAKNSIYLGAGIATHDYDATQLIQGNFVIDFLVEKRFKQKKRIDYGLFIKSALVKNLTDNLTQNVNSSWRVGLGSGANIKFKFTNVLAMILQYNYHQDVFAKIKKDHLAILGTRHGASLGINYSFN